MCDAPGAVEKPPTCAEQTSTSTDKDSSEAGAESNRDSGYGPSTGTQRSSTNSSFSRGCFSGEESHRSSGSETSSGRLALAPGAAPSAPTGHPAPAGTKAARQLSGAAADSGLTPSEDKSVEDSFQAALQKGAYQHVMSYVRKILEWEKARVGEVSSSVPASSAEKEDSAGASAEDSEPPARLEVLVSLRKGTVVRTSGSMAELLGYPPDMWVGRSFIDYIYPRDRASFTNTINDMGVDVDGLISNKDGSTSSSQLFCRLRHHRGLKSVGFNVVSHSHIYRPFQLRILFHDLKLDQLSGEGPCILVVADVLQPAYKSTPEGVHPGFRNLHFSMRHTAQCRVDQYDSQGITLLGFLPQDVVGRSMVDLFHPEDLPAIKDVYRKVTQRTGTPFRSRPYRLRAHNGCYVGMETDWSCFVNPWSNRIEAVICKHRVIKAPSNLNIFDEDEEDGADCADKLMLRNSHRVDIENILSKVILCMATGAAQWIKGSLRWLRALPAADSKASYLTQRRRRLVALMESLISDLEETVDQPATPDQDHTSVPGDVSPHTSERGSPAPISVSVPNYVQLNYKETINRFFESHPKTAIGSSDESDSRNDSIGVAGPSSGRRTAAVASASLDSPQPGPSGVSAPTGGSRHSPPPPLTSYHHQPLTQAVLDRHNADMEKNMRQSLGPKKHICHSSKCKMIKHNSCSEPKKGLDEFEQERRHAMLNTAGWPAPSVFWPPFSACLTGPGALAGVGAAGVSQWVGAAGPAGALRPHGVAVFQPVEPPPVPPQPHHVLLGPLCQPPQLMGGLMAAFSTAPPPAAAAAAAAASRKRPVSLSLSVSARGGLSSGEQSGDCTTTTSESLRKMNLDSDEDLSKEKRGSDLTFSDSSLSSALRDVDGVGDGSNFGWPSYNPRHAAAVRDEDQPAGYGPSSSQMEEPKQKPVLMDPPWLVAVSQTCELTKQYQLEPRNLQEVLEQDRLALTQMTQPATLTEQLSQLYQDLQTVGAPSVLNLEERDPTSGSSDESSAILGKRPFALARPVVAPKQCRKRRAERRQRAAYIRRQRARLRLPHQVH
ncbi:Period circadian protein [Amphibalanus amphitrite]|uniref:Period circadian protein n=1 Tax=Amphibalanus amphitrite TaxID=1232801 RepID=A0A6A4W7G2_AMPAM|nr:Period circadian protein [Amphibalanus amphitrite]